MSSVVTAAATAVSGVQGAAGLLARERPAGGADPVRALKGRGLRYKDRATKLAMAAARPALEDAGLLLDSGLAVPNDQVGVIVSSNFGNVDSVCETVDTIARETVLGTSPMMLPNTASNVIASWVAITFGLRGANLTLCNGPTSGLDALYWARVLLDAGRVRHVLVVGVEPDNPPVRYLTPEGVRPFDGAAALVVEPEEAAASRGVRPLARLGAYARRDRHDAAVAAVWPPGADRIGLWLKPENRDGDPPPSRVPAGTAQHDLAAVFGRCSGALGVLQCAAGTAWLARESTGCVLASAGGAPGDDAAAALIVDRVR